MGTCSSRTETACVLAKRKHANSLILVKHIAFALQKVEIVRTAL